MFKTETHLHTAEVSRCGKKRAFQMIRAYKEAGYSTVFVTDHFQMNTLDALGDISWADKVTIFLSGYYAAKCEGEKIGVCVLPGAEICFGGEDPNHYLVYGLTKEFLLQYENPTGSKNCAKSRRRMGFFSCRRIRTEMAFASRVPHLRTASRCITPTRATRI